MRDEQQASWTGTVTRIERKAPDGLDLPKCLRPSRVFVTFDDPKLGTVPLPAEGVVGGVGVGTRVYVLRRKEGRSATWVIRPIPERWKDSAA